MNKVSDNLTALEKYKNNFYAKLKIDYENISETKNKVDHIESIDTLDNIRTILVSKNNYCYRLNSIYHPLNEVEIWINSCNLEDIGKVISVFGLGNGLYLRTLLNKLSEDETIIIYEPSIDIFNYVLDNYDIIDIIQDDRTFFVVEGINDTEFRQALGKSVFWSNLYSQRKYALPQYEMMFPESYEFFIKELNSNNDTVVVTQNTDSLFGKIVVENTFSNLKYFNECNILSEYIGAFPDDVPAIIVSAGPSLDKNIEELKKINKRAVIFVVDRALEYVYSHNIEPDYAVTIDPKKPIEYFAKGYSVNVPLFAELHSNKQLLDVHHEKKIFYNSFWYIDNILKQYNKNLNIGISVGKSVATAAFSVCIKLGFKRIILIGQDLAYSSNNSTHAGGINTETDAIKEILVEGIDGKQVRTRFDWYEFLKWFEDTIEQYPEIDFIDATEGGAKIKGTRIMTLTEVIDNYCIRQFDTKELESKLIPTFDAKTLHEFKMDIIQCREELDKIKREALEAKTACIKLVKHWDNNNVINKNSEKLIKKVIKANEYICTKPMYSFVNAYIVDDTRDSMKDIFHMTQDEQTDMLVTFQKGKEMYEQVFNASNEIKEIIDKYYHN